MKAEPITDDLDKLLEVLPPAVQEALAKNNNNKDLSSLNSKFYIQVRQKMSICHKTWILDSFLIDLAPQGTLRLNYYLPN